MEKASDSGHRGCACGRSAVAVGAVAGGTGGLGSSLTSQAIQGDFSLGQTIFDTTLGVAGGAIAGRVTSALTGRATNTAGLGDDAASIISGTARGQSARLVQGLQGYLSPAENAAFAANPARVVGSSAKRCIARQGTRWMRRSAGSGGVSHGEAGL